MTLSFISVGELCENPLVIATIHDFIRGMYLFNLHREETLTYLMEHLSFNTKSRRW